MSLYTIYGRPACPYCDRAKQLCQSRNLPFEYIDMWQANISKEMLEEKTGAPVYTVPQIFFGEQHIGGYDNLVNYLNA